MPKADHGALLRSVSAIPAWRRARWEVDHLADKLGRPLDGGIKETVAILRALEIPTSGSCEGHPDRGLAFPWVDIAHPRDFGERERTQAESAIVTANLGAREQLHALLVAFYREVGGEPLDAVRLVPKGIFGATRMQAGTRSLHGRRETVHRLAPRRWEMMRFTDFLLERFRLDAERPTAVR